MKKPTEIYWTARGNERDYLYYGDHTGKRLIRIPAGWVFLAAGAPAHTRAAIRFARKSYAVLKNGRYGYSRRGVWITAATADKARAYYVDGMDARAAAKEKRQERDESRLQAACVDWLNFAPAHELLCRRIAASAAEQASEIGSGRVGRARNLDIEERARLACRATIRHEHTDYDYECRAGDGDPDLYDHARHMAADEVDEFLAGHRLAHDEV